MIQTIFVRLLDGKFQRGFQTFNSRKSLDNHMRRKDKRFAGKEFN